MRLRTLQRWILATLLLVSLGMGLSGCGGGGGGGGNAQATVAGEWDQENWNEMEWQ